MTHDPDHDQRAMAPDPRGGNGLHDPRLTQSYRDAQRAPQEQVPWELQGARRSAPPSPRSGPSPTVRVVIALLLVIALVATLVGRW